MANQNYTHKKTSHLIMYKLINTSSHLVLFLKRNLDAIGNVILALCPIIFLSVGEYVYSFRGYLAFGSEIALTIIIPAIAFLLKAVAKEQCKPLYIPVPRERLTQYKSNGEYVLDRDRIYEAILYLAELEDWLEDEGYIACHQKSSEDASASNTLS